MIFPGGEVHTSIKTSNISAQTRIDGVYLTAKLKCSNDIMELLLLTDAYRRTGIDNIYLEMKYIPYARQDRICNNGEALSIKVFADLINAQNYLIVYVFDPHSDVAPALINNCYTIPRHNLLKEIPREKYSSLISPDVGASKKCFEDAKVLNLPLVQANKRRDLSTGQLSGFEVYADTLEGDVLITDDICDGGGTFIGLATLLKEKGAKSVDLFITHGIFSKGFDVFKGYIDNIYTTNSWHDGPTHIRIEP